MKKIAVLTMIVAAMCCAGKAKAQRPVGDTIFERELTYFHYIYNWYEDTNHRWMVYADDDLHHGTYHITPPDFEPDDWGNRALIGNTIYGVQMYTERPMKVVGIAAPAYMQETRDTSCLPNYYEVYTRPNTWDTTLAGRATDSMILYKPVEGGNLVKLMDGPWRIENPHRYISLPPRCHAFNQHDGYRHAPVDSSATSYIAPLYEVMFDKPVVVEDSFVVAITTFNNEGHKDWVFTPDEGRYRMWLWDHNPTRMFSLLDKEMSDDPIPENILWYKYRVESWRRFSVGSSQTIDGHYWFHGPLVFPIIEPGFDSVLCHEVRNLRVAERGGGTATLMWDAGDGGPWIVSYGKVDDAWEDFTFDTVSSPMVTLTGLEVGTQYFALVRGYCSVTGEYGEWTSPLEVEVFQPGHEEPEGIEHPGDLGRFTRLVPNPARGEVNVVSSFRLSRIELYSLDGRKVLEQEADGISSMVDVSGLASGTYIVALYLPHGVATKKLVKN